MINYKHKKLLIDLFRWAINKSFEEVPEAQICENDVAQFARDAWQSLVDDGTITLEKH